MADTLNHSPETSKKIIVTLPELGDNTDSEVIVSAIMASPGDTVALDDDLVEVVTDKAAFTVPSPEAGTITAIRVRQGDTIKPGDPLVELDGIPA